LMRFALADEINARRSGSRAKLSNGAMEGP
jgi:hypothetical protein